MPGDVSLISDFEELEDLAPEWSSLTARAPASGVFQRPEWMLPWWRTYGSGRLWTLAFRREQRLVGLLPMFLHEWEGRRQLTLMGNSITDHLDLIVEPSYEDDCADAALRLLATNTDEWDLCDWQDLPARSPLLRAHTPGTIDRFACHYLCCSEAPLPPGDSGLDDQLPHGLRRNIRRYGERLREEHEVRFETHEGDASGEIIEALFRLHRLRWESLGEPGMLAGREQFFRSATPILAGAGLLRLHLLRVDETISGVIYSLLDRGRAYGYITGFDPALDRYSPGTLLLDYAMRRAIAEGATAWDFLRGRERYKFQWGAQEIPKARLRFWNQARHMPAEAAAETDPALA